MDRPGSCGVRPSARPAKETPEVSPESKTLEAACRDVRSLSEEAFRVLLVSMEAERSKRSSDGVSAGGG